MSEFSLKDKIILITGSSRGIGREMALRFAQEGAKIVIAAKTAEPHPTLEGTIYSVAAEVERAGGVALPLFLDVRNEENVIAVVNKTVETFGGIDILINNASAINLSSTIEIPMKRFDLIFAVNVRGTFMCSKYCIPHLKQAANPHILNLSPPLNMDPKWFKDHLAYTISKYDMSMCTLGLSEELKAFGIGVNSLWPKTLIATAAIAVNFPKSFYEATRKPSIIADAAYYILTSNSREVTGNFYIDEFLLKARGVTDFSQYNFKPGAELYPDLYV